MSSSCPACGRELTHFAGIPAPLTLLGCRACGGLWFDNRGARMLVEANLGDEVLDVVRLLDASAKPSGDTSYRTAARIGRRQCPVCDAPLDRTRVESAGVEIDLCAPHGTWFDRAAFRAVHQAYALAGAAREAAHHVAEAEAAWKAHERRVLRGRW
jgi:Zn-finger nucleic acid-binding protein